MPIYEYRCDVCGHTLEVFQKFSDEPLETCEVCGGRVAKVLHPVAIHFKGSGFYTTDYGRGSRKARAADAGAKADAESKAGAEAKAGAGGKGGADSKGDGGANGDAGAKTDGEPGAKAVGNGNGARSGAAAGGGDAAARRPTTDKAG